MSDQDQTQQTPHPQPTSAPVAYRRYRMPRYGRWIGLGFLLGLAVGLVIADRTNGPALVSPTRSYAWLGIVFASLGALVAAVAAVVVERLVNRDA